MEEPKQAAGEQQAPGCFLCLNLLPLIHNLWTEETRTHFRNSRVEFLKGVRGIIDDRIAHLSREEKHGTTVTVE